jgi:hypothetical protein
MSPAAGTNPFDDDNDVEEVTTEAKNNSSFRGANASMTSSSSNPFHDESFEENPALDDTHLPVEASWQYLGDLPYRRIPIYSNIVWHKSEDEDFGLASFPPSFRLQQQRSELLLPEDVKKMLNTSTITKIAGCPHGGPIAVVTLPILGQQSSSASLNVLTNAGVRLASIPLPPPPLAKLYSASDVMTIGFTHRTILVVILRDSLCLTYNLQGQALLPPFHILPPKDDSKSQDLLQASVFEGGVAVLSPKMQSALVEFLDQHDDPSYANGAHLGARRIAPKTSDVSSRAAEPMFGGSDQVIPSNYAIVTPLPTASYCRQNGFTLVSLAVLPRLFTTSRHPEVFLSTSDNSVIIVNSVTTEITDVECRHRMQAPIVKMSFAPNGRFLACFTQNSILTVISTSFETKVLDFDTSEGSQNPPQDMVWCGEDSVVLHWKKLGVLMVGPYGDWLRFPYEDTEYLHLISEIDSCRVITDHAVELLQRVPPATAALLRMGSIEPSAMLLDASDAFDGGSPSSDEAARAIVKTGMLAEAIETCTDAAVREFDVAMQKRLLRAASYGMHFAYKDPQHATILGGPTTGNGNTTGVEVLPSEVAIQFTAAARKLRVLNALRDPRVGFVLTSAQFDHISATGLVARLVATHRPALAAAISQYLDLPYSVQLYARSAKAAAYVITDKSSSDAETAEAASKIINEGQPGKSHNSGGYASVALAASKAGRPGVANLLLMLESSVADKVPALISTGNFADAMAVATSARDAEYIFFTLMEYEKACMASSSDIAAGQNTFLGTVISKFTAEGFHTLRRYLETTPDIKNVMNLLLRAQKSIDAGSAMAKHACGQQEKSEVLKLLAEASRLYSLGKDTTFHKTSTDEQIELLNDQEVLRNKYGVPDVAPAGASVTETIVAVINHAAVNKRESHRLFADVEKLAKKFRIPDKRLWYIKVKALSESNQWPQLRKLAESKTKPPIGFKPFAMAAIKGNQGIAEIMAYVERVTLSEERYDLFCEAKQWKRALDEAGKMRDSRRLANVRSSCNSPEVQRLADEMLNRLSTM